MQTLSDKEDMHDKNKDEKRTQWGKYPMNGYFFDSIAKSHS